MHQTPVLLLFLFVAAVAHAQSCPAGWDHSTFDDSCNIVLPRFNRTAAIGSMPTYASFDDATAWCASLNAALPIIVDNTTQLDYYTNLTGVHSGVAWWVGVRANPSIGNQSVWITANFRTNGFQFLWDTKRDQPNPYGRCVIMHQLGNASARVYGGNGAMVATDCEKKHSAICTMQRVPVAIEALQGEAPAQQELVYGYQTTITFYGSRIPNGTQVSLQTQDPSLFVTYGQTGAATNCVSVTTLTGASTPLPLTIIGTLNNSLCVNASNCTVATITLPASWPFVRGANYSFCFFVPLPFSNYSNPAEFQNNLLGPAAMLTIVQGALSYLRDTCSRFQEELGVVLGTGTNDAQRAPVIPPMFNAPIQGQYNAIQLELEQS